MFFKFLRYAWFFNKKKLFSDLDQFLIGGGTNLKIKVSYFLNSCFLYAGH